MLRNTASSSSFFQTTKALSSPILFFFLPSISVELLLCLTLHMTRGWRETEHMAVDDNTTPQSRNLQAVALSWWVCSSLLLLQTWREKLCHCGLLLAITYSIIECSISSHKKEEWGNQRHAFEHVRRASAILKHSWRTGLSCSLSQM